MYKKLALLAFAFLCIIALVLNGAFAASSSGTYKNLSSVESTIVSRINGTSVYDYDLEVENITLDHSLSLYSFRSSGSVGANETAMWIQRQFESFGLDTHNESFEFTTWNLLAQPVLVIDADGNQSTTDDQVTISSFQSAHYGWPTPDGGVFASLVELPVPYAGSRQSASQARYDASAWMAVNTTGKVLLIGAEVGWNPSTYLAFKNKLQSQTPVAVIFARSYDWMAWAPPMFSSSGGRPASMWGAFYWDFKIPVGWVNYVDGQLIRSEMAAQNISAFVSIHAVIGQGPHYNIVAKLAGSVNPEKEIIISAHYDSVMDAAFCDNGAGVSAVLELAKVFSEAAHESIYKPQYTLVFITFAGEELGLVGSMNYVKQHASELGNVVAVINMDSLGSETMEISKTFPDDSGLDLQSVVMNAANDLGVPFRVTDPGGSDQETFRNPVDTDDVYGLFGWGSSGIRNMTRVKSSIMIDSYPLFYSDVWNYTVPQWRGKPGWLHTEYDNSTTPGWVTADRLESQTRVAGLSVMRVLSTIFSPFLLELYWSAAAVGVVFVVAAFFERSRLRILFKGLAKDVRSCIGMKEVLYIIILTVIFLFVSFALHLRVGETEVIRDGYPTIVNIDYYGTPFEMFGVVTGEFSSVNQELARSEGASPMVPSQTGGINMLWGGLLMNVILFLLFAFVITYAVTKLKYLHELSKR